MNTFAHYDNQPSGYVDITCYFAKGSDAKGCKIIVQNKTNATFCDLVATREDRGEARVTVALPNRTYALLIYDVEDGAVHNPALTATLNVLCGTLVSGMESSIL